MSKRPANIYHLNLFEDEEGHALQLNEEIVDRLPWLAEGCVARVVEGKVLIIEKSKASLGDNIRRKPRPMTERAKALHKHLLAHPELKDEGGGVLSVKFEANEEADALDIPLDQFLEDSKILYGRGIIRETEFMKDGDKLFYKHCFFHPDLFNH